MREHREVVPYSDSRGVANVTSVDSRINVDNSDSANPKLSLNTSEIASSLSGTFASSNDPRFDDAVKRTGDTMSGPLVLPNDGLIVGSTQLVVSGGRVGIGTNSPSVRLDIAGAIKIGADGSETCGGGSGAGTIRFTGGDIQFCTGSGWQTLGGTGGGGGAGPTPTFAVQTTGNQLKFESVDNDHTLYIPMASTAGTLAGLISNADYAEFSSKLSSTLDPGKILIGNSSSQATAVLPSGDATISQTGVITVQGLRGKEVSETEPVNGQVFKLVSGKWEPVFINLGDIKNNLGLSVFDVASCGPNQTVKWSSLTDKFECLDIEISMAQIPDLGTMAGEDASDYLRKDGNLDGLADKAAARANLGVTSTGDAIVTAANAGAARAAINAMESVTPGAADEVLQSNGSAWVSGPVGPSNFANQAANLVFASPDGSSGKPVFRKLASDDIQNLDWTKVTNAPNTLSGYGISDAVKNDGGVPSLKAGPDGAKGSAGTAGRLYIATDTKKVYYDTGSLWIVVGTTSGSDISGDISGNAANVTGVVAIEHGGTGATTQAGAANAILPPQAGNAGKVLMTDGANVMWAMLSAGGSLSKQTVSYTTPGTPTWTKPSDAYLIHVECWGGGGAGGRGSTAGTSAGCGGGGGSYVSAWFLASDLPSTVPITVGAGGTGSSTSGGKGGDGGSSSFGTFVIAPGGVGGTGSTSTCSGGNGGKPPHPIDAFYYAPDLGGRGAGGSSGCSLEAGNSQYGGGGGGARYAYYQDGVGPVSVTCNAGLSAMGGSGGANGAAGEAPGGGGSGVTSGTSGAGGAGRCRVTTLIRN